MREEWTEARIDELGNGLRPVLKAGPFGSSVTKETYQPSGYKVYGQQEVVAKDLGAEAYFVSEATFNRHKSCAVKPGDLLMTMMGTIGRVYRVPEGAPEGIINPRLVRIAFDTSRILPEYAEVAFEQPPLQRLLNRRSHGGTMQGLNMEALASIRLLLPPIPVQREIAEIMRTWDSAVRKTEQLIAAKERHYSHELSRLISRGQHPHAHVGSFAEEVSASNPSRAWRTVALSDIASIWKGQQLNKDAMVEDGAYYALNGGIKPSGRTTEWNCEADTITISEGGNSCGFVSYNRERFWCGGHCYALRKLAKGVDAHYLFHFLKGKQTRVMALRVGSGLPNIQKSDIEAFPVILPDLFTQSAIARYLNALREEIHLLSQSVATLKTQKRGLMQKLLTGQWRMPVQEKAGA
ncbi:MAG: restriction endonuclease subunit S [Xanthomonadaceae bacterium]|nr:restriction endonuclease subunit S [Xanthomonadaceae bacterium]